VSGKMSRESYEQMIREDLEWLMAQPRTLEREHIAEIVRQSPDREYAPEGYVIPQSDLFRINCPTCYGDGKVDGLEPRSRLCRTCNGNRVIYRRGIPA
jgi:hypothetical protein